MATTKPIPVLYATSARTYHPGCYIPATEDREGIRIVATEFAWPKGATCALCGSRTATVSRPGAKRAIARKMRAQERASAKLLAELRATRHERH